jgi:dTMP kinase
MLIVFEGIDGTGKSTLAARLAAKLRASGVDVVETREPWTSAAGLELKRLLAQKERTTTPEQELDLFQRDRAEHVERVVKPALARGAWVVQDRTFWSTAAYQGREALRASSGREARRSAEPTAAQIVERSLAVAPKPDLTLLLTLDPQAALARITRNRGSTSSFEKLDDLRAVAAVYEQLAAREPSIVKVAADAPLETVEAAVVAACRARCGRP